jgi:hypothetical protein
MSRPAQEDGRAVIVHRSVPRWGGRAWSMPPRYFSDLAYRRRHASKEDRRAGGEWLSGRVQ